jgi:glutamyl-tRNA synthetase
MISEYPRVRFAPSPTGYLHVGGLRTALYNFLFARKNNGKFILRIEDTDRTRYVEGAVENLINTLKWCNVEYDEGPDKGGDYGPYIQSQRLEIYQKYAKELIENGKAYYCFCTPERLDELRKEQEAQNLSHRMYDKHCLHLSSKEIKQKLENNTPYVIRLNVEHGHKIKFNDIIRGEVEFDTSTVDDQVLIKSDGYPTYHMACVVDDHLMKITHVIRGEEWLPSTPKHVLLYNYFGWEIPEFAHLPLLLNPDKSKLSKRQGDVAVEDYRAKGYLKEALLNFIVLLGWNNGDDREFYYLNEMIELFDLNRVNKSGAVFNIEKLNWLNAEHLRKKPKSELLELLKIEIENSEYKNLNLSDNYLGAIIDSMLERVSFVHEFITKCKYFYEDPKEFDMDVAKKRWNELSVNFLKLFLEKLEQNPSIITKEDFDKFMHDLCSEMNIPIGKVIHALRLAVSGIGTGPGMFDILAIIGRDKVIKRIKYALQKLGIPNA